MYEKSIISVDCETSSLNPIDAALVGISFGCDTNDAYYIPVAHKNVKSLSKEFVIKKTKIHNKEILLQNNQLRTDVILAKSKINTSS